MFIDLTTIPASTVAGMPGGLIGLVHDALQKGAQEALGTVGNPANPSASTYWNSILTRGLNFSYYTIVQALMQRGYSKKIIDQWDRGIEFQGDLGIWYCLQWIATQTSIKLDQESLKIMDRRPELWGRHRNLTFGIQPVEAVGVTINGLWIDPDTQVGQVVTGPMQNEIVLSPFNTNVSGDPTFDDPLVWNKWLSAP